MSTTARKLQCYELAHDGHSLGLFRTEAEWMGLTLLRSLRSDDAVIVDFGARGIDQMSEAFAEIFGSTQQVAVRIVRATFDIAARLNGQEPNP